MIGRGLAGEGWQPPSGAANASLGALLMHLGAFGIKHVFVADRAAARTLPDLPATEGWGLAVEAIAADDASLKARLDSTVLLVDPAARLVDLSAFLTAPGGPRLLVTDAGPAGFALVDREGLVGGRSGEGLIPFPADRVVESGSVRRPAAFLDRDGVINMDEGYSHRAEDLVFTPTAIEAIRLLNSIGHRVIVVTNQSGVARGYYGVADVERFHRHMRDTLMRAGAHIDAIYFSPHHPDGSVPAFAIDHEDRKPSPGMLLRAMRDWDIVREGSFMIGDKASDIEAAERAGIPGTRVVSNSCDLAGTVREILKL